MSPERRENVEAQVREAGSPQAGEGEGEKKVQDESKGRKKPICTARHKKKRVTVAPTVETLHWG